MQSSKDLDHLLFVLPDPRVWGDRDKGADAQWEQHSCDRGEQTRVREAGVPDEDDWCYPTAAQRFPRGFL